MKKPDLILCDHNRDLVAAWEEAFAGCPEVEVRLGDLLDVSADAYVSPANSYGHMDGGIDLALRDRFGHELQQRVWVEIERCGGRLPVGEARIIETEDLDVPYLIIAPTMEVPAMVAHTNNAFRAMYALLVAWRRFEEQHPGEIAGIAIPGLCTGVGAMEPEVAAGQMRRAWDEFRQSS